MAITPALERWLKEAGYKYHCFVSYPRVRNTDIIECSKRVKDAIENHLALDINPSVFLDETITGGADWQSTLRGALCRSITMIAICAPIYYHPDHSWCGLEWAAMDCLCDLRLPGRDFRTIIPLMVREEVPLPEPVSKTQYINISRVMLQGRRYYKTLEFRRRIEEITRHIEKVAFAIRDNDARPDCEAFAFPEISAFANWQPAIQLPPFRNIK